MEFLEIIEWLRARHDAHVDDPVRIVGAISEDELGAAGHILECLNEHSGPIVYWGGAAHSAVAPAGDVAYPPKSPPGASDGTRLRQTLGPRYLSVGCICDHAVSGEALPPPPSHFAEAPLAHVDSPAWYLDLREPDSEAAQRFLGAPATTRLIGPQYDPDRNADFSMSGSPFGHWFDAISYIREVTPTRPMGAPLSP